MSRKRKQWDFKSCQNEATKYSNGTDFAKYSPGAYNYASKHGIMPIVTSHFKVRWQKKWADKETCRTIASKYQTKIEFYRACEGAYLYAVRHGFLDEICSHMVRSRYGRWHDCTVKAEALKYKSRKEFAKEASGAWNYAYKHNILDEVCEHMDVVGNKMHRCIYAVEFLDNCVYVGLTYNPEQRWEDHLKNTRSAVYHHIKETNLSPRLKL